MNQEIIKIAISEIAESSTNPRLTFDTDSITELSESIKRQGILNPLIVRKIPGGYELVAGARRLRAAKYAGLSKIPCLIRSLSEEQAREVQLVENIQREDVHPMELARSIRDLMQCYGWTAETVAVKIGKTAPYIWNKLKLLKLEPYIQKYYLDGEIGTVSADSLARLTELEQRLLAEKAKQLSPTAFREVARQLRVERGGARSGPREKKGGMVKELKELTSFMLAHPELNESSEALHLMRVCLNDLEGLLRVRESA